MTNEYTQKLKSMMQLAGIPSFAALSRVAGVSEWQVTQLRQGRITEMRVDRVLQLSQALQVSPAELLATFAPLDLEMTTSSGQSHLEAQPGDLADLQQSLTALQQEYHLLEQRLEQQRQTLQDEFQRTSLQIIESWMAIWPTAAHAAQKDPTAPAVRLLPLLRPIEQLLQSWGVETIATVGTTVAYDPQIHQLLNGQAQPGDSVEVSHAGYRHGDRLLFRARVKPSSG